MIITSIIVLMGIVGILLQAKIDETDDKPKRKRISKIFIISSITLLIINSIKSEFDSNKMKKTIDNLDSTNMSLNIKLDNCNSSIAIVEQNQNSLKHKYDSLYYIHSLSNNMILYANDQIRHLTDKTEVGFNSNIEAIEKIEKIKVSDNRTLSPKQKMNMIKELIPGKGNTIEFGTVNDGEALSFSKEIQDVFREAGWTVKGDEIWLAAGIQYKGFFLFTKDQTQSEKLGYVFRALRIINPDFLANVDPKIEKGKLKIVVGYK